MNNLITVVAKETAIIFTLFNSAVQCAKQQMNNFGKIQ